MTKTLSRVAIQLETEKRRLEELFNLKGYTDIEVLKQSYRVDRLINQYERMVQEKQVK